MSFARSSHRRNVVASATIALVGLSLFVRIPFQRFRNPTFFPQADEGHQTARVLLLGDSITHQYFPALARQVPAGTVLVALREARPQTVLGHLFLPSSRMLNARDSGHMLANLETWMQGERFDTIIVNVGLHDLSRPPDRPDENLDTRATRYRTNLREILAVLQRHAERVCFVSTTPPASSAPPTFRPEMIARLNQLAIEVTTSLGADFLDLRWPSNVDPLFSEDGYHLSSAGVDHVARFIASYLQR